MKEVHIVYSRPVFDEMPKVSRSQDADTIIRECIDTKRIDHKEFFWILLLNRANKVLAFAEISKGDSVSASVSIKEIMQLVLLSNSVAIILIHNHPSGQLKPSQSDINFTKKIQEMALIFNVNVFDHLIITSESYYSFADNNAM